MEPEPVIQLSTSKIYKNNAIRMATFIGGPLVGGYLIAENFKAFNEPRKAKKTWIYTIIATVFIFSIAFLIPDSNKIPKVVFPLLYTWTAYYLVQYYQASYISSHINAGGQIYNWWRTIAVALIGLAVTFISIVVTVYFSDEITNPETVSIYGAAENEIHFNNNNISYIEIGKLGEAFEEIDFFSDENKKFVYVKKIKNDYEISISCNKKVINNPDIIEAFSKMRIEMQKRFPKNKLIFNLVVDRLDNIIKRIK